MLIIKLFLTPIETNTLYTTLVLPLAQGNLF